MIQKCFGHLAILYYCIAGMLNRKVGDKWPAFRPQHLKLFLFIDSKQPSELHYLSVNTLVNLIATQQILVQLMMIIIIFVCRILIAGTPSRACMAVRYKLEKGLRVV